MVCKLAWEIDQHVRIIAENIYHRDFTGSSSRQYDPSGELTWMAMIPQISNRITCVAKTVAIAQLNLRYLR